MFIFQLKMKKGNDLTNDNEAISTVVFKERGIVKEHSTEIINGKKYVLFPPLKLLIIEK